MKTLAIIAFAIAALLAVPGSAPAQFYDALPHPRLPSDPLIPQSTRLDPLAPQIILVQPTSLDPLTLQNSSSILNMGPDPQKPAPPKSNFNHPPIKGYRPRTTSAPFATDRYAGRTSQPRPTRRQPLGW